MNTISANDTLMATDAQRSTKLKALLRRWREALAAIRDSRRPGGRPSAQAVNAVSDLTTVSVDPLAGDGDDRERELVPLPDERSQALAVLCDRLLEELDGTDVKAAEIRFVVHRNDQFGQPRLDPASTADPSTGELVWELRRLLAWSGGAIADVAHALETRGTDLDECARALLQEELAALDVDLATVNVHLSDPVDWDGEFGCLLAGEVAPFDDLATGEDDDNEN